MGGNDADLSLAEIQFRNNRPTRLNPWKLDAKSTVMVRDTTNEKCIPMPAMAIVDIGLDQQCQSGFAMDGFWIKQTASLSEAMINLLKGDQVCANFSKDLNDAARADKPVRTPTLMDIVRSNFHNDLNMIAQR